LLFTLNFHDVIWTFFIAGAAITLRSSSTGNFRYLDSPTALKGHKRR